MLMCRDVATLASDYIDDELGPLKRLSVGLHLMMCRHCRSFIGNLRETAEIMAKHSSQQPATELIERIDRAVDNALAEGGDPH